MFENRVKKRKENTPYLKRQIIINYLYQTILFARKQISLLKHFNLNSKHVR